MSEIPNLLAERTIDVFISPTESLTLVKQILNRKPGLFIISGQPGTGKTTTLCVIANYACQQGYPITFLTEDKELLNGALHFSLPQEWQTQCVETFNEAWKDAVNESISQSSTAIVIDLLSSNNVEAAFMAAKLGHWVFVCVDTPFVGVDVLYNLRGWGLSSQELLDNISGILSQMLLPKLCENCRQLVSATLEETRLVHPNSADAKELWHEIGCPICQDRGTKGRCVVSEVLMVDDEVRSLSENYLVHNILNHPPANKHFTIRDGSRNLVKNGIVGIETYQREVLQNPLLRIQHFWEQERLRASQIQSMFSRFVTQQLVDRIISQQDFERIIEGERRYVTCCFCDIRGFTTRAEKSTPMEIFLLLNQYFREIIDIVFRFEGTIDKFIGDSIMVVFGAPIEQNDQELRAVQCAIAIQQKVAEINRREGVIPVHIGIGINSGEVVAGCLGSDQRMDYTILGDVVNTAARLESNAQANQILLGSATYSAVREKVECLTIGFLSFKGKLEPLEVFEVVYLSTGQKFNGVEKGNRIEV